MMTDILILGELSL